MSSYPRARNTSSSNEQSRLLPSDEANYTSTNPDPEETRLTDASPNKPSKVDLTWIMMGLFGVAFLNGLDATIVATLQTPIGSHFNSAHQASYLGTSYLLSVCCFTPLYGRLSDILGRKGAILLGVTLFGAGTVLCAVAPTMYTLIAARAVAGMGGGGIGTVSFIIIADIVSQKDRGIYQGLGLLFWSIGSALGGPLGGLMNDTFGWRSAFYTQFPVIILSFIVLAWKMLAGIDWAGSSTLVGCVGSLLLALSLKTTEEYRWDHPLITGLLVGSVVFGVLFFLVEKYWAVNPIMPLRLVVQRTPLFVSLTSFFMMMQAFITVYNIPLYFTTVRLQSAADAGLHLLPQSASIAIGSLIAGWVVRQTGKYWWFTVLSYAISISGIFLIVLWDDRTAEYHFWLDAALTGLGGSSVTTTVITALVSSVAKEDIAVAMGISFLFRTTAQVLGVSFSGILVQDLLLRNLRKRITGPGSTEIIERIRHSTLIIPKLSPELRDAAIDSYAVALKAVFICQLAISFIGFLCCLPIQEFSLSGSGKVAIIEEDREASTPERVR